jgi:inactivated superfamily I helicase
MKTDLDLCRAEMKTERQTHQRKERALHVQVIEAEKQRDAAVQEALKKVEAMEKECDGILSSFMLCSIFFLIFCSSFV